MTTMASIKGTLAALVQSQEFSNMMNAFSLTTVANAPRFAIEKLTDDEREQVYQWTKGNAPVPQCLAEHIQMLKDLERRTATQ